MRVWDTIASQKKPVRVYEAPFIADVRLVAEAAQKRGGVALYIAKDDRHALMAQAAARFFAPLLDVIYLPAWDCLPYDRVSPSPAIAAMRCAALARLAGRTSKAGPMLMVTTASSLVQRVPPRSHMGVAAFVARVGEQVSRTASAPISTSMAIPARRPCGSRASIRSAAGSWTSSRPACRSL